MDPPALDPESLRQALARRRGERGVPVLQQARGTVRDNAHRAAGLTPVRFTHGQVRFEPGYVEQRSRGSLSYVAQVRRAPRRHRIPRIHGVLSERQQRILLVVTEEYLRTGKPVGSKAIADRPDVEWSASTVRNEFAALERDGYLTHPHTSAGRVPTDRGYRFYADSLLATAPTRPRRGRIPPSSTSPGCAGRSRMRCGRRRRRSRG